jgi:hypothetical protein
VIAATGSYVDPVAPTWAPAGITQYLVSAAIETVPAHAPIRESGKDDAGGDRGFVEVVAGLSQAALSVDVAARPGS